MSPVLQLDRSVAPDDAGHEVEPAGLPHVVEQPGALPRQVREQGYPELIDQVELDQRTPEADAAADNDVAVAAAPEPVNLVGRIASRDRGVGPVGGLQRAGEDDLARALRVSAYGWLMAVGK
jgi:hypothetical protein